MRTTRVKRLSLHRRVCITTLIVATFLLPSFPAIASQTDNESATAEEKQGYPVIVDGYELFRIHETLGVAPPEVRAERISAALEGLAKAQDFDPSKIQANEEGGVATVRYGDQLIVTINDAEAKDSGLPRNALASQYALVLQSKLSLAHEQHTHPYLWKASAFAAITILIYLGVVWVVIKGARWILEYLQTPSQGRIQGIRIQQSEIIQGLQLRALLASLVRLARIVVIAVLSYGFLAKAFSFFPWTRLHSQRLLGYLINPLITIGQAVLSYLPKLFYIFVIIVVLHFVLRFIRIVAREIERGRIRIVGFYPEWVQPTYKIIRFLLYAFGAVLIYPYLPGEGSPAFKGIGVFLGVLFSLGSTSAVANFVAGVILIYTRGYRIGDWVTIGGNTGEVVQMTMLASHIRTIRNEEITIPNSVALSTHVTNFSLQAQEQGVILHTSVTIGYDQPWRTIQKLLIDAALRTPDILPNPQPFVLQAELEDSYVKYEVNAYTNRPLRMPYIYSDLHANIQDSFYEAGVEIMSPVIHGLRDLNHVAIPDMYLPKDYRAKSFRVERTDLVGDGGDKKE
jgi:small-conductance mechanosensitive channel